MKIKSLFQNVFLGLALYASCFVHPTSTLAYDTWLTVDQPGFDGFVEDFACDKSAASPYYGTLYAVGDNDFAVATIRKSTDGGLSWQTSDQYTYPGGSWASYNAVAVDSAGTVYAAGDSGGVWFVRKSMDGGTTWVDSDVFESSGGSAAALGVAIAEDGTIYVAGAAAVQVRKRSSQAHWIVRRCADGSHWETVDDYTDASGAAARNITVSGGAIYVVGVGSNWLVRKGTPNGSGGVDWETSDAFSLNDGLASSPQSITADAAGNLYVAGYGDRWVEIPGTGRKHKSQWVHRWTWVVRSLPLGGTWQTIDEYRPVYDYNYEAHDIAVGNDGTVWVTGYGYNTVGSGSDWMWITRKLPSGGNSSDWRNSEVLPGTSGESVVCDAAGNIFTGGDSTYFWTVRALVSEE